MTYNVFSGTLNPTHSLTHLRHFLVISAPLDVAACNLFAKKLNFLASVAVPLLSFADTNLVLYGING